MVMQPTADWEVGGSIPGMPDVGAGVAVLGSNRRPTRLRSAALPIDRCSFCSSYSLNCLKPSLPLEKKPKLCASVCLCACPTDYLTHCWPV